MIFKVSKHRNFNGSYYVILILASCIAVLIFKAKSSQVIDVGDAHNFETDGIKRLSASPNKKEVRNQAANLNEDHPIESLERSVVNNSEDEGISVGNFISMVDSLSLELSSDLLDSIFDSDIIDAYENNFAEIFERQPTAREVLVERAALIRIEESWEEVLFKSNLSEEEEKNVRGTLLRLYIRNMEYSDMHISGDMTSQEWLNVYVGDNEVLDAISSLISEDKFRELKSYYVDKRSNSEPDPKLAAIRRDSFNFPAFDAIYNEDPVLLESLLAAGADVDAVSEYSPEISFFARAIDSAIPEMIEVMLAYGADIDSRDIFGNTMLHRAALDGNIEIVNLLIEAGASPLLRDSLGFTPAMQVRLGRSELGEDKYNELHTLLKNAEANVSQ